MHGKWVRHDWLLPTKGDHKSWDNNWPRYDRLGEVGGVSSITAVCHLLCSVGFDSGSLKEEEPRRCSSPFWTGSGCSCCQNTAHLHKMKAEEITLWEEASLNPADLFPRFKNKFTEGFLVWLLTDSRLGADERAVLWDKMCVVALARQNLEHFRNFLTATFLGSPVYTKTNICPVTGKLPPVKEQEPEEGS